MKAIRIVLLGFAAAIFTMALEPEAAAAQCWTCDRAFMYDWDEDRYRICYHCSGDRTGYADCGTRTCTGCWNLGTCGVAAALDGRSAAPDVPETTNFEQPSEAGAFLATFTPADHGPTPPTYGRQTRRSCDGGIISKWYSAGAMSVARGATARLRL